MAINVVTNPVDDSEMTIVSGVVGRFSFKEKPDQFGNTHQAGIQVDGQWVNMKLKVKEGFEPQIRFAEGKGPNAKWMTLDVGDEVKMVVKPNVWNGTTSYNVTSSNIKLVKKGNGTPPQTATPSTGNKPAASGNSAGWKKDNTGVEVGHAVSCAIQLVGVDSEEVVEAAKAVHTLTMRMKAEHGKAHPEMSEYDVGASVGHAVKNACVFGSNIKSVEAVARNILENVIPDVTAFVKNGNVAPKAEVPAKAPPAKAPAKPAVKAPAKAVQELDSDLDDYGDDGFNDDLVPF